MAFNGLSVEGSRDAGDRLITYFTIPPGQELAAGHDLLACLADGIEVCLRYDMDDGSEGLTTFRRSGSGLFTMVGGHGWQGAWKPIDEADILAAVAELAAHNRGGPAAQGSLIKESAPNRALQQTPAVATGFRRFLHFLSGRVR